ncbi:hypothetical protein LPJ59_006364, partial [Coemansia sp. RSA 2399]
RGNRGPRLTHPTNDRVSASVVINDKMTAVTIHYPDSYLTQKGHTPTPTLNNIAQASHSHTEWRQNVRQHPAHDANNIAMYNPHQTPSDSSAHKRSDKRRPYGAKHKSYHTALPNIPTGMTATIYYDEKYLSTVMDVPHSKRPKTHHAKHKSYHTASPNIPTGMTATIYYDEKYLSTVTDFPYSKKPKTHHAKQAAHATGIIATVYYDEKYLSSAMNVPYTSPIQSSDEYEWSNVFSPPPESESYSNVFSPPTEYESNSNVFSPPSESESNGNVFSPPSDISSTSIIYPEATMASADDVAETKPTASAHTTLEDELVDPAYPVTIAETSSGVDKPQCTWDGVQVNDPVAWKPVAKYKYKPIAKHAPSPGSIDDDIHALVHNMTLKEKIGQMTQIEVGQLVDCNGFLNETAVKYWIN